MLKLIINWSKVLLEKSGNFHYKNLKNDMREEAY
jgi:hypothetical protein